MQKEPSFKRSAMDISSSAAYMALLAFTQTSRVGQLSMRLQSSSFSRHSTNPASPSRLLTTAPTVMSSGDIANVCPPPGPRLLAMNPAFLSSRMSFSRYFVDSPCRLAMSLIRTGPDIQCMAISSIIRVPYLLRVVSLMKFPFGLLNHVEK